MPTEPTKKPTVSPSELARLRERAAETRAKVAHKPGISELLTPEERADAAPFYFELRACIAELKKAREAAGLTLAQVAEKTGLAAETLCRLETGAVTNPTWQTLGLYAVAVGRRLSLRLEAPRMFELGTMYTRKKIADLVGGGDHESYLPNLNGRVLAACLRLDQNPGAPYIILPASGDRRERAAELLTRQREPVPMFLKRGTDEWEYIGDFVAQRCSRDREELAAQKRMSGRDDILMVIHMVPARASADSRA
jgi:transcriptional regulator with XRE-family HTH domain